MTDAKDWSEGDLARAFGGGVETDVSRALAQLVVVALSARADALGVDWDGSWNDALTLGLQMQAIIPVLADPGLEPLRIPLWAREDLTHAITRKIGDRKTAETLTAAYLRATKDDRNASDETPNLGEIVERCVTAYRALTSRP